MTSHTEALTDLLTRVIDSADGYEQAADSCESGALKDIFSERAKMRRGFAAQIRAELERHGEDVDDDGSLLAAAHRVFLDLKTKVSGDDNEKALEEVERGESVLVDQYEETLRDLDAGSPINGILTEQLSCVRKDLNSARKLEEAID